MNNSKVVIQLSGKSITHIFMLFLFTLSTMTCVQNAYAITAVDTVNVNVSNSITGNALPDLKVHVYERLADSSTQWRANGYTDTSGRVSFDLEGLAEGRIYYLKTKPYSTGNAYSEDISTAGEMNFNVGTLQLTVTDYNQQTPLADTKVSLYERLLDGSKKWAANGYTDAHGVIRFTPTGLGNGRTYLVRTKPYGAGYAYSQDISTAGETTLNVGTLLVTITDFNTSTPLADTKVYLYQRQADGSKKWAADGYTESDGTIRFTPFGLEQGQTYLLRTKPYGTGYAYSKDISAPGATTLNVGTLLVKVNDFSNNTSLAETKVYLYQRQADGSSKRAASGYTDANGIIRFTPFGIEEGQSYFVKTKPYSAGYAYSKDINVPGETTLNAGTLPVTISDFSNNTPVAATKVYLYKRQPDGSGERTADGYTDANGIIRFTPFGLEEGQSYYVRTKPYAAGYAYSKDINVPGATTLKVGTLVAKVTDYINQSPLADTKVYLYKRQSDGSSKRAADGYTDANGIIRFTPFGLEDGQSYFVKTKPFATGYAYSKDFSAPSSFTFDVGTLQVKVIDFIKQTTLTDLKVHLYERLPDGSKKWRAKGYTNDSGLIRFSPFGLEEGRHYLIKTSPYNTGSAYSEEITTAGELTFSVGTLQVKLLNYIDNTTLTDTKVHLYERLLDGTKKWRAKGYTDANGLIRFTPLGLGNERTYYVTSKPYNAGDVNSEDITTAKDLTFFVNSNPVTLINGDTNQTLVNHKITAYKKLATGDLKWVNKGYTNDTGTVHFDLSYTEGETYVFYVRNVFGEDKKYYSQVVAQKGAVTFIVTVDGENTLDLTPPEVSISSPIDGGNASIQGFQVSGLASDNKSIDKISLSVNDSEKGITELTASYDATSKIWSANVTGEMITLGNNIVLTATASDLSQNQQTTRVTIMVTEDSDGPEITITSHSDNQQIPVTGFLLSGTVIDLTQVVTLNATVTSLLPGASASETLLTGQAVDFSQNGNWTLVLNNGLMTVDAIISITLEATDSVGNTASTSIQLIVEAVDTSELQMINRITFGATPTLLQEVEALGAVDFLNQQLDPNSIDNSAFEAMITGNTLGSKEELQAWTLMHMIYSKRQLQEVMTWFWDNHFNTDINTTRTNAEATELSNTVQYELDENIAFRANALGNFRTLLGISAKSPAMLIYLDAISNVSGDSNENYAREVMELSTMGVSAGYTDEDVEAAAEIFTGWHVHSQGGGFVFHAEDHTIGSYTLFANTGVNESVFIPQGGEDQGDLLLDALAEHRATSEYICGKLITLLVSDTPSTTLLSQCATEFRASSTADDQIKRVLLVILQSAEFNFPANYRNKIKTPVEFVVGAVRNLEAQSAASDLINPIKAMGIRLYENPVPTGWSETGSDWINSSLLIERIKWVNDFVRNPSASTQTASDPLVFYPQYGFETPDGIAGFLLQLTVGDDFTELSRNNALDILGVDFDLTAPGAEIQLRQLNGNVLSYPQYQFQ